jgi:serine/threonine protein kinase
MSFTYKPGDILENRYQVLHYLASGRFAEVYHVQDLRSQTFYALKIFKEATDRVLRISELLTEAARTPCSS